MLWCPPASGAGRVTSYTVTAEPGGESVTADVPNDWAIVDGLSNGTSYTFSVVANASAASASEAGSSPAAATNPVTPEMTPQPSDVVRGTPKKVTYDGYSLMIGGKRVFITAGEFDPWRTPSPSLWLDLLQKMKADGYNAVTVYFDWAYQSPSPGVYDFTGVRDMNEFLNMAQEAGLYVIARPGPYINAETNGGGIPAWVLTSPNGYRSDVEPYLSAALQWYSEIDPIIAAHQVTRGGDVILYQIENEYTAHGTAADQYMADLEQQAINDGIDVPFTFNQCCGAQTFTSGLGAVDISGTDNYPLGFNCANTSAFTEPYGYPSYPGEPVYLAEFQGGSFDGWGGSGYADCYKMTGPDFEDVFYKNNVAQGVTISSNYMGVGGTNWGWLPDPQVYTSYDYGAAISETGEIGTPSHPNDIVGSKYGENKLINEFETSTGPLTETQAGPAPTPDNNAILTMSRYNPSNGAEFVYLRQANASSTATVSTHLALNTDVAAGYTYDDTSSALVYSGNWTHAGPSAGYTNGDYDQTESWSQQTGASVSVTFTGTAVQWIGPKNTNGGIAAVSVDGASPTYVDTYDPCCKEFQQVLFADTGLTQGTHTLTITVTGNKDPQSTADTVVIDAINVPTPAELADYFPVVPQTGTITLEGRDARLLVANCSFGGQHLVYSTSELTTHATIGGEDVALLYDPAGTDGETVLNYTSKPAVEVLSGNVQANWGPTSGDLRLDYVHNGLQEVRVTGGGRPPLLLLIAGTNTAEEFWPEQTSAGPVLVEGAYLVRTARVRGSQLLLTGDTSTSGPLSVWAGPAITSVYWDGAPVAVQRQADGSLAGTVPGPAPVMLPVLTGWKFAYGAPEAQPGFNDSNWTLADHPVSNAGSPSTPVLYASDYGYGYGFVWYRGHFMATGNETGVKLTVDGVAPTGAYSAWLNGAFLGSAGAAGPSTTTFTFPAGSVKAGKDNVIAILVENTDNPEGPSGEKVGLYSASLVGSSQPITWRLKGADPVLQDPVRGIMNAAGLYGSEHGWDLPGYPDGNWTPVTLPDSWAARGVPAGIGWYRTTFNLHLPPDQYVPVAVQIGGPGPSAGTANYRAFIYVNGWLIGRYVNNVGPQHQFYVPAGILNDNGLNTIAIADWGLDEMTGGLAQVSLVALGNQLSSLQVQPVASPGYNPAVYGPPTPPVPTLGVVPSTALAEGSFTVTATLTNPTHAPLTDAAIGLSVPSGWTLTSDASTLTSNAGTLTSDAGTVAPRSARSVQFFVTAPASGLTPGTVGLLTVATFGSGPPARFGPLGRQFGPPGDGRGNRSETIMNAASLSVPYPDLASTFNNTGVTDNSDPNPYPGFIGFDGGGTSYSAQGLAADGITPGATVSAGGLSFTWPDVAVATPDNTMAEGQIIALTGAGTTLGFLAAANNSPESGTGTVYYTDGTSQSFTLDVGNFWYPSGQDGNPENVTVASVNYANYKTGSSGHTIYLFEQSVALETGKTVEAVRLPALGSVTGYEPALHVFALSIGG